MKQLSTAAQLNRLAKHLRFLRKVLITYEKFEKEGPEKLNIHIRLMGIHFHESAIVNLKSGEYRHRQKVIAEMLSSIAITYKREIVQVEDKMYELIRTKFLDKETQQRVFKRYSEG